MRKFITIVEGLETPAATLIARVQSDVMPGFVGRAEIDLDEIDDETVEIEHIAAFQHRQGTGSKLLGAVCDLADALGVTLTLGVANETDGMYNAEDDPSEDDLIAWYERFGFDQDYEDIRKWIDLAEQAGIPHRKAVAPLIAIDNRQRVANHFAELRIRQPLVVHVRRKLLAEVIRGNHLGLWGRVAMVLHQISSRS